MFISLLKNKKLLLIIIFLVTFNKYSYGMYSSGKESERGCETNPHHVVIDNSPLWEIGKAVAYIGMGAGCNYAYQRWYLNSEKQNIENKEKLLELDIKESNLIQTHQEESIRFLRCEEKGLNQQFCQKMLTAHTQALERIIQKNPAHKNNINQKLS